MGIRQATGIRGHAGGPSITVALLVFATLCLTASPAAAQTSATTKAKELVVHRVVVHPGTGLASGGSQVVRQVQRLLAKAGYSPGPIDGRYGPITEDAVLRYQANAGLQVDGIAGPKTLAALATSAVALRQGEGYVPGGSAQVRSLQRMLAKAGYSPGAIDGRFGPRTQSAARRYQAHHGIAASGIVNSQTFNDLRAQAASAGRVKSPAAPGVSRPAVKPPKVNGGARTGARPTTRSGGTRTGTTPKTTAPAPSATTPATPATPAPSATTPAKPAPSATTPAKSAPAQPGGHSSGAGALAWILPLALLILVIPLGFASYLRRRRRVARPEVRREPIAALPPPAGNGADPAEPDEALVSVPPTPETRNGNGKVPDISDEFLDTNGAFDRGLLLEASEDLAGAEAAYRLADKRGHAAAASNLGVLLEARGDRVGAEAAYRRADERGDANGAFNLAVLLEASDDIDGAEAAYRRADERGHAAAASNLGVLLEARGDRGGAEAAYRRADERGEANGAFNLAVLLEESQDFAGAEAAYGRAEETGDEQVADLARAAVRELESSIATSAATGIGRSDDGP